jgi:hypothetical protein
MAEMTISLRCDPATGKKNIIVTLRSDEDALPQEHEQIHRRIVDQLIHGGLLQATEAGRLVIEREDKEQQPAIPSGTVAEEQRQSQKSHR